MKYFYIGLLILCLLLCACYFSSRQIRRGTEAMAFPLRQALQAFRAGNLTEKARSLEEAAARWKAGESVFASLLSHDHTAGIAEDLRALALAKDEEFEGICFRLLDKLDRIRRMDLPILENIL